MFPLLAPLLLASSLPAQVTLTPQIRGGMIAELTVRVAEGTAEQGLAEVTLSLTVKGPKTLQVEPPRLGDPINAWQAKQESPTRDIHEGRKNWRQVIHLKQNSKGVETLPDVSLRFRDGTDSAWQEAKWLDILKQMRDGPRPPLPPPPRISWLWRWGLPSVFGVAVLVLLVWMMKRRRRQRPSLSPEQWALRELERLEQTLTPPHGDAKLFHTQLSLVVRRYLAERYAPHALQQTTAEFLQAVRQTPQLSAEQQERLRELFERCDWAKFAGVETSAEECRRTAEMVHKLVHPARPID